MDENTERTLVAPSVLVVAALVAGLAGPLPVAAQEGEGEDEERPLVIDEITVSAQKRDENLQEVPISISAFSDVEIEEAGIETPEDFIGMSPNITIGNSFTVGNSFVTVRGITQINNSDPSVAIVVDGVYQANQKQLNQELFDIERIEVLRGPQGAIYGRNSLGGAINIITRAPDSDARGWIQAGIGNGNARRLAGAVGGAMGSGSVFGRLTASTRETDGLIRNTFLDELADPFEDTTVRGRLKLSAGDSWSFDLRAQSSDTEGGAVLYSLVPTTGGAQRFDIRPDENILGFSEREIGDLTLKIDGVGRGVEFTSISAQSDVEETYRGDLDFSNPVRFPDAFALGQGQDLDVSFFSQELRLASTDGGRVRWMFGSYYLDTDRSLTTIPFFDVDGTIGGFVPLFTIGEDNANTAWAGFGQIEVDFAEAWEASFGLRYDEDERNQTDTVNGGDRSRTFDDVQPRFVLSYSTRPEFMAYGVVAGGFRSGGYNAPPIRPDFFRKETTDTVEIGFKSLLANNRVRLNGAAYRTDVSDFQFFRVDIATASQIIDNVREVRMEGVELDLLARVRSGWDLLASVGLNDSSIGDFDGSGRFVGNQSPNNVRSTINLGTVYSVPMFQSAAAGASLLSGSSITSPWLFSIRADVELRGKQYWFADNLDVTDPVEFVNLRLGVDGERWNVTVWGRNLLDEDYWAEYFDALWGGIPSGMDLGHLGRRRTIGLDVKFRF